MESLKRYSRFIDSTGRLFIVLGTNSKKEGENWKNHSIDLLNVNNEQVQEVKLSDFENYTKQKLLIQVK